MGGLLYPGVTIEKFECANHTQKRAMNSLVTYGVKYEGEGPILSGQAKPPSDPTTPSVADFFPKVPKPTQEAMSDPVEPSDSTPQPSPPTTAPPPPPLPTPLPTPLPAASSSRAPDFTPSIK